MFPQASVSAGPAIFNDSVFAASEDGSVTAVASDNREPLWPLADGVFKTGGAIYGDLAADESGVFVASSDSKLYCLNRANGKIRWQYFAGTALSSGPVITKDLVFQMVPGKGLVAIDKVEGSNKAKAPAYNRQPRWVIGNATQFLAEDEKFVFVRRSDNTILAVDKVDGHLVFTSKRKEFRAFGVNTKDSTIYAATKDGQLIAIQAVTKPGMVGQVVLDSQRTLATPLFADAH